MKISPGLAVALIWIMALACSCNNPQDKNVLVAKAGDRELTWEELKNVIPDNSSNEDSIMLAESYISNWVKEQLIVAHAEANLSEEKRNFDDLIEKYRKSLVTYEYEQELIRQKLDTNVSMQEIEQYYNDNIRNFQLKDYILKVKYCAVNVEYENLKNLGKYFYSEKPEDLVKWQQLCVEAGAFYYFNEEKWMLFDEFLKQVPLEVFDFESFLKKNKNIDFEKDNNKYLITITDYQLSGSVSPLSFEKLKIRDLILNKRKMELLDKMRSDVYDQALRENKIEYYYKNE